MTRRLHILFQLLTGVLILLTFPSALYAQEGPPPTDPIRDRTLVIHRANIADIVDTIIDVASYGPYTFVLDRT